MNTEDRDRAIAIFDEGSADELVEKPCSKEESLSYMQALSSLKD